MASELRWILLGLGLALIAGLWWWERRRPSAPPEESSVRVPDRFEPRLEGEGALAAGEHGGAVAVDLSIRAHDERPVPRGDPPLVTIDDLPENTDSVVLAPAPLPEERPAPPPASAFERRRPRPDPPPPEPVAAPLEADEVIEVPVPEAAPAPPVEPPPRQQRIVAIRLIGERERRIDGAALEKALAAEGLEFGRYSIFHRPLQGGRPLYSVASLVEPGSFDPGLMASIRFPGISLFAVYPGPMPAPQAFDEMLATARRLAERLGGALQDDSGSSLTGQRVLSIREELVHFEHLVALSRTRPGA
jgi:cell division protein ZipA